MRTLSITSAVATAPQEHVALCRAYGAVQERCSRLIAQQQADIHRLEAEVVRLRAAVMLRETALSMAQEQRGCPVGVNKPPAAGAERAPRTRLWQWLIFGGMGVQSIPASAATASATH